MKILHNMLKSVDIEDTASLLDAIQQADRSDAPFNKNAKIHFLRNFTIEGIEPYLKYHLYASEIEPGAVPKYDT